MFVLHAHNLLLAHRLRRCVESAVFVVGAGRSGTTAICRALNQHPSLIIAPGEAPMIQWMGKLARHYDGNPKQAYYQDNTGLSADALRTSIQSLCFNCVWGNVSRVRRANAGRGKRTRISAIWQVQAWGAKAFPDQCAAAGLAWLFRGCRFIYIYRNGIDVVHSMSRFHAFRDMPFEERCRFWAERVCHYDYLRQSKQSISIRFEDFLEDPGTSLRSIFGHLKLRHHDAPMRFASSHLIHPLGEPTIAGSPKEILRERSPSHETWSLQERELFRQLCSDPMEALGYAIPF